MISASRLMTLSAVEDHDGVVGAAAALHLTPSAVSQQLRQLEREAGVALLDRSGRQVRLTEAGGRLAARGRSIAREVVLAADDVVPWSDAVDRDVTVAAFQTVICQLIAPMIADGLIGDGLIGDGRVALRVTELEGPPAIEALHGGQVDVVMTEELLAGDDDRPRRAVDPVTRLVIDDRYRLAVPADWVLDEAEPDAVRRDLVTRPWVAQAAGTAGGEMLADLERRWSFSARTVHTCTEYTSAVALVEAGVGATLAPHLALPHPVGPLGAADGSGRVRILDGAPDLGRRRVRALCRPVRRPIPSIDRLLRLLADRANEMGLDARMVSG